MSIQSIAEIEFERNFYKSRYEALRETLLTGSKWCGAYKEGFTIAELIRRLNVSRVTLHKHEKEGLLKSDCKNGKMRLFSRDALLNWHQLRNDKHKKSFKEFIEAIK